ncbi:hypothetical protein IEQ34_005453 [Dendrobium chrysotoxum]|uniref:Phosphatidylinositol N-acetylglucosaminyltransferase subunit H conserved domain-containing protein n=1 Tax=Dendrobium chrysotoxum TaxID=161865 RepID=A0AAV7HD14_DENCH|nr:hypothetical protein IEQ34_005453 [Dendrobium chrysotoxum]
MWIQFKFAFPLLQLFVTLRLRVRGRVLNESLNNFFAFCRIRSHTFSPFCCWIGSNDDDESLLVAKGSHFSSFRALLRPNPINPPYSLIYMSCLLSHNDKGKYRYCHHNGDSTCKRIDVHEIFMAKSRVRLLLSYIGILVCLVNCYISLVKDKLCSSSIWKITVILLFAKFMQYKPVKKESIVILPEFGVQLETHYWRLELIAGLSLQCSWWAWCELVGECNSGQIARRFVPGGKILRPVLNECVTPLTCYWSLALILHGEDQLMLVFQELKPPLKLLVPIWKALRSSFDVKEGSST